MKTKAFGSLLLSLIMAASVFSARAMEEPTAVAAILDIYGGQLPQEAAARAGELFAPSTVEVAGISFTFAEAVCDGRWVYTAVEAEPVLPEEALLMPGSAWAEDLVSGLHGERARQDNRTFYQAALEDGKRLLVAYAYILEFDELDEYFLDHFQRAGHRSTLLSGGKLPFAEDTIDLNWCVEVMEIDLQTGETVPDSYVKATFPVTLTRLPLTESKRYRTQEEGLPFEVMTLTRTPLTMYTDMDWQNQEDAYQYGYVLLNESGVPYPEGASMEIASYAMDAFPDVLWIQVYDQSIGETSGPFAFIAGE